ATWSEYLADLEFDEPAHRVDQEWLVGQGHIAIAVGYALACIEHIVDRQRDTDIIEERHAFHQPLLTAQIGEYAQVHRSQAAEFKVGAAGQSAASEPSRPGIAGRQPR